MRAYLKGWLYIFIGIAILYFATGHANAQWAQGPGHAYLKLGSWNQSSNSEFESNGKLNGVPFPERTFAIRSLFARVGVDSLYTATLQVPLVYTALGADEQLGLPETLSANDLGDINVTLERSLWNNDGFVGGAALTLGIPTGTTNDPFLATGDGEWNQMLRLLIGSSYKIGKQNMYWKGYAGFNHRTKGFSNEYRLGLETGATVGQIFALARVGSTQFFNDEEGGIVSGNFLNRNYERVNIGAEVTYYFAPKFGVSAGYNHILSGRNIINAPAITYGLIHKF